MDSFARFISFSKEPHPIFFRYSSKIKAFFIANPRRRDSLSKLTLYLLQIGTLQIHIP